MVRKTVIHTTVNKVVKFQNLLCLGCRRDSLQEIGSRLSEQYNRAKGDEVEAAKVTLKNTNTITYHEHSVHQHFFLVLQIACELLTYQYHNKSWFTIEFVHMDKEEQVTIWKSLPGHSRRSFKLCAIRYQNDA